MSYHGYADDTHMYVVFKKENQSSAYDIDCAIELWLTSDFLLLNDKMTAVREYNSSGLHHINEVVIGDVTVSTQP